MTSALTEKKSLLAWVLYDVGSSGYIFLVPGIAYAIFFRQTVCGGGPECDAQWGSLVSLTLLISGILAPLLGAIADLGRVRHQLFVVTTLLCSLGCLGLVTVQPGAIAWGMVAFALTQGGYLMATGLYDAYLPQLGTASTITKLSGWGWGLGYLGGIICYLIFSQIKTSPLFEGVTEYRLAFVIAGIWLLMLCLPALLWLPRPSQSSSIKTTRLINNAYRQVWQTLKTLPQQRPLSKFLLGFYLISSTIITLNNFLGIYLTTEFGLSLAEILRYGLLFNLISVPATIIFGILGDRLSLSQLLFLLLAIWATAISIMAFSTSPLTPLLLAILFGMVFGSTQSLCRSWFAQITTTNQATELFGFNAFVGRLASLLGPLLFSVVSSFSGNQRLAIIMLLPVLALGIILIGQVRLSQNVS
ncbi:MFS transporter [Synechocystis salina LEGE 06099]|uniref:MFS transporter n=1 Tax=Synechocystis salina TaxID=945780 RepID=UPI00187FD8EF|nr:MFS transporter [Synechocystis salina]MBE9204154.1 MFS transporter [Synechocystis salina LEGE 06099]